MCILTVNYLGKITTLLFHSLIQAMNADLKILRFKIGLLKKLLLKHFKLLLHGILIDFDIRGISFCKIYIFLIGSLTFLRSIADQFLDGLTVSIIRLL